jgi:hypothetical protein
VPILAQATDTQRHAFQLLGAGNPLKAWRHAL